MDWGNALAQTFLVEAETFGEVVLFRGHEYKAVVGVSDQLKGMEMGGYLEQQSIEIIFPNQELVGMSQKPKPNEVIRTRGKAYRIHSVEALEQSYSYKLTCELIPLYQET
jgi:hypothetical protein